jgi:hypothetical protein
MRFRSETACVIPSDKLKVTKRRRKFMANYIIIGGDGREYGPVSGEDLRKWIAEGRLNAQSQVKAEGDAAFRPLSAFPEFANAFGAGAAGTIATIAPPSSQSGGSREAALQAVKGPAIALIITASLGAAYYAFIGLFALFVGGAMFHQELPPDIPPQMRALIESIEKAQGPLAGMINLAIAALNGFVIFGAVKMLRLQSYGLAMAAAIVAMLPCQCCCVLGLPFGIWALVVMNKPEVKSQFG